VLDRVGRRRSLRSAATAAGIPTIVYEAGETFRFQRREIRKGLFGVYNVLAELGMLEIPRREPAFQVVVKTTAWIRAPRGGILDLTVRPGDLVYRGDPVGRVSNPFGRDVVPLASDVTGVVLGTTTLPLTSPGDAVAHVARLQRTLSIVERHARRTAGGRLRVAPLF